MQENDFKECRFIDTFLKFYTLEDFYRHRILIRSRYKALGTNARMFYKWYVYANINMNETQKNVVWEYLNNDTMPGSLIFAYIKNNKNVL